MLEVGKFQMRGRETRIVKAKINIDAARAARESPQSANSRTECMEVIIAGQSNAKEDEGQLMQFAIGQCLTTEKCRKWKRLARQGAGGSDTKSESKRRLMSGIAEGSTKKERTEDENTIEQMVEVEIKEVGSSEVWVFIGVHLSCSEQIRFLQFEKLTTMSQHLEEKVVIAGDFNAITSQAEKEGGGQKSAITTATFTNFIDSNKLVDIGMVGRPFTWTNRRQGEDLVERLDRYLVGMGWKLKFPNAVVHKLTESGSDHAPILMEIEPQSWHSKRYFKYQERWCREEGVKRTVSEVWRMEVVGSAMFSLAQKLKDCRHRLVQWQKTHKANSRKEIEDLQAKLEELRVAGINRGEEVTSLEEKLELAYLKEESYWREKSRVK
nr:uncharacterized protein LOC112729673 [Arachis hypogaea]